MHPAFYALLVGCVSEPERLGPRAQPPMELGDPVACPVDPRGPGFDAVTTGDWADVVPSGGGQGLAVGDLDDDGWLDVLLPTGSGVRLYLGSEGGLVDASDTIPVEAWGAFRNASVADADGDGDLDAYLGSSQQEDLLLRNRGDATFTAEVVPGGRRTMGSAWADADGDGDLDLAVANGASSSGTSLLFNRGDGRFDELSAAVPGALPDGTTFVLSWVDLDGDGLPELYRVSDVLNRVPNKLWWNRGGRFFEDDGVSGLDVSVCGMGLGIGDVDGDGRPDLAMSDCSTLWLLESSGGHWVDWSSVRGLDVDPATDRAVPWGVDLADIDNDGDLDAFVAYGYVADADWPMPLRQPDGLYLMGPDGTFTESSEAWGLLHDGGSRGFVWADLTNDGRLDLVAQDLQGRPLLYTSRCGDEAWLRISLRQAGGNPFGVGARVEVRSGDRRFTRWILAGGHSLSSGGPPEAHVGLGDLDEVDIVVSWPDGGTDAWTGVPTGHRVTLYRD